MARYAAVHTLNAERDALFLKHAPRDGLWFQNFTDGDVITCCHKCRRIFFESDWTIRCPVCGSRERLYFTRPNMLLATEIAHSADGTVARPLSARKLTNYQIEGGNEHGQHITENAESHSD